MPHGDCCMLLLAQGYHAHYVDHPASHLIPANHLPLLSLHTSLPRVQPVPPDAGPITLYNPYQSSTYNAWTNPAEAAIDGNILTSSQTAVDTASCKALNDQGQYGVCGLMSECTASPYFTGAYASTPSNPYWTAGFSSDISVSQGKLRKSLS